MILYAEDSKDSTKKLLEWSSAKLQGTKSTYKYHHILNSKNEQFQKEIQKTIPFIIVAKRIKYLGVNIIKEVEDLYIENYKLLLKEINTNGKTAYVHELEDLNVVETFILPKSIYKFQCNSYQNPTSSFCRNRKNKPKIHM